jgi:hypothetical protein
LTILPVFSLVIYKGIALLNIEYWLKSIQTFKHFFYFYQKSGFFSMFMSGRNDFIKERFLPYLDSWNAVNWAFGGTDITAGAIEMDFHDMLLMFGLGGCFIYISYTLLLMWSKKNTRFSSLIIIVWLSFAAMAGHFFYSTINVVYLSILLLKVKNS